MFAWLRGLFGIGEVILYLFRCAVCAAEEVLSLADAKAKGWRYQAKSWRCGKCAN
jgi:hypothetical protein